MAHILEITPDDINKLGDIQLTDLLLRLLRMEAQKFEIPKSCISGSLEIKASDGGEDAHIKWSDGPEKTEWIPNRYTLFQCKAEKIEPKKCKTEILSENELKPRVKDVKVFKVQVLHIMKLLTSKFMMLIKFPCG
jgi:hypothetical protein